jgi:energy-converting hydrogenase A subunit G
MWNEYSFGLAIAFACALIGFAALTRERDDLHKLLLIDLVETASLAVIALIGTDLAEALILPGLVVGIAELLALSQIYLTKEGYQQNPVKGLNIEVMMRSPAPVILSTILVVYGIILSGFTGGGIAGLGVVFFLMSRSFTGDFHVLEIASGISWALWVAAFFVFMFLPGWWYFALLGAAIGILLKVITKMSLVGAMWGETE